MLARLTAALAAYGQRGVAGVTPAARLSWSSTAPSALIIDGHHHEVDLRRQLTAYQQAPFWRRWYQRWFTPLQARAQVFYYGKLTQWCRALSQASTPVQRLGILQQLKYELMLAKADISVFSSLYRPIKHSLQQVCDLEKCAKLSSVGPAAAAEEKSSSPQNPSLEPDDFQQHLGYTRYYYERLVSTLRRLPQRRLPPRVDISVQHHYQQFDAHQERVQLLASEPRLKHYLQRDKEAQLATLTRLITQRHCLVLPLQQGLLARQLDSTLTLLAPLLQQW